MDRKDEIIQMQNEIMQGLLDQRMKLLSEDLWGIKPLSLQNKPGTDEKPGDAAAPVYPVLIVPFVFPVQVYSVISIMTSPFLLLL